MRSISVQEKSYNMHCFPSTSLRKAQSIYINDACKVKLRLSKCTNKNGSRVDADSLPDKKGLLSMPHQEGLNFSALSFPAHQITQDTKAHVTNGASLGMFL